MSFLTATTLISAHGAGITVAAGTKLTLNLTEKLTKCQADLMQYCSWPLDASTGVHLSSDQLDPT